MRFATTPAGGACFAPDRLNGLEGCDLCRTFLHETRAKKPRAEGFRTHIGFWVHHRANRQRPVPTGPRPPPRWPGPPPLARSARDGLNETFAVRSPRCGPVRRLSTVRGHVTQEWTEALALVGWTAGWSVKTRATAGWSRRIGPAGRRPESQGPGFSQRTGLQQRRRSLRPGCYSTLPLTFNQPPKTRKGPAGR